MVPTCTTRNRQVTLLVTSSGTDVEFAATTEVTSGVFPCLLDADNLRTAAQLAGRLEPDEDGNRPLPLLRIWAPTPEFLTKRHSSIPVNPRSILFSGSQRLLTGLIADAVAAGGVAGAVVHVPDGATDIVELRRALAVQLEERGFEVALDCPGWVLVESALSRAG